MLYINKAALTDYQLATLYECLSTISETASALSCAPRCQGEGEIVGNLILHLVDTFDEEMNQIADTASHRPRNQDTARIHLHDLIRRGDLDEDQHPTGLTSSTQTKGDFINA
ncbi:hypothetical protein [Pseudovibrio exalbescens]|uniref:hypothetical protein n=1 Tax=Pseudovibrio exalbescens TaxID=197461 RepID=UPI0015E066A8|nr:hypothetical protein [Pseudovibrio exalbescens]